MPKVKTFTSDLSIFKTIGQLENLDKLVNKFLQDNNVKTIYSVSDTTTVNENGATMGVIRTIAYD
ncbi:hypothetical protein JXQ31_02265 [candidate division KSB1 bacterium]|nr:hypothetical protein [candidate division KSB1 bacterium]